MTGRMIIDVREDAVVYVRLVPGALLSLLGLNNFEAQWVPNSSLTIQRSDGLVILVGNTTRRMIARCRGPFDAWTLKGDGSVESEGSRPAFIHLTGQTRISDRLLHERIAAVDRPWAGEATLAGRAERPRALVDNTLERGRM